jgi:hypothetical protein
LSAASSRQAGCIERSRENLAKCSATLMSSSRLQYPYLHTPCRYPFGAARASYPVLRFSERPFSAENGRLPTICLAAHAMRANLTLGTGRDVPQKRR